MLPHNFGGRSRAVWLRRLLDYRQMDIEFTFWQMLTVCTNPSKLCVARATLPRRRAVSHARCASYRTTSWHKQTKNQWARDDPAFVAIQLAFLVAAAVAQALALGPLGVADSVKLLLWTVGVEFVGAALLLATASWLLCNRYLRVRGGVHTHRCAAQRARARARVCSTLRQSRAERRVALRV